MHRKTAGFLIASLLVYLSILITHTMVAKAQGTYAIYRTVPVNVTAQDVVDIAANFSIAAYPANVTSSESEGWATEYYVNTSWPRFLEVFNVSGSIWYRDYSKWFNEDYVPASLPDEISAEQMAEAFIKEKGLGVIGATYHYSHVSNVTIRRASNDTGSFVVSEVANCVQVHFYFNTSDGYRTRGPGAKMVVAIGGPGDGIGSNSNVIGFYRFLRNLVIDGYADQVSLADANQTFLNWWGSAFNSTGVSWGYWCEPIFLPQDHVQPMWIFDAQLVRTEVVPDNETQIVTLSEEKNVPASLFSPQVSIVSPERAKICDKLEPNGSATVLFNASIRGGTPPYSYELKSNFHGELASGVQNNEGYLIFNASLEVTVWNVSKSSLDGNVTKEYGLTEVELRVIDVNGIEVCAQTWLTVRLTGDIKLDLKVDIYDAIKLSGAYGAKPGDARWNSAADLNYDRVVDIYDAILLANNFNKDVSGVGGLGVEASMLPAGFWSAEPLALLSMTILAIAFAVCAIRRRGKIGLATSILLTMILVSSFAVLAYQARSYEHKDDNDNGEWEVGCLWINAYENAPYEHSDDLAADFHNKIRGDNAKSWQDRYEHHDKYVHEDYFKARHCKKEGHDYDVVDIVDFCYFAGRADSDSLECLEENDYYDFLYRRAHWGGNGEGDDGEDADLEWIVMDANEALVYEDANHKKVYDDDRWGQVFESLHIILGFATGRSDIESRGRRYAEIMINGEKIIDAWCKATQETEESDKKGAAYYANDGADPKDDYLPGHGDHSEDPQSDRTNCHMEWYC